MLLQSSYIFGEDPFKKKNTTEIKPDGTPVIKISKKIYSYISESFQDKTVTSYKDNCFRKVLEYKVKIDELDILSLCLLKLEKYVI